MSPASSRLSLSVALATSIATILGLASCGAGNKARSTTSTGGASGSGGSVGYAGAAGGVSLVDAGCLTGQPCGDGGICAGTTCCSAELACGDVCCAMSEVCSFQKCVTPGAPCADSSDCMAGEYCESQLGEPVDAGMGDGSCVGAKMTTGRCLPSPPTCAPDAGANDAGAIACLEACSYKPTGTFNPVLEYSWGGVITSPFNTDVMMAPIVLPLEDTNCDGKIDQRDIPSIVFSSFANAIYNSQGTLHAIRVVNGALADRWMTAPILNPRMQIAGGNIDGKPGNEIVACSPPSGGMVNVMAFNGSDGSMLWSTPVAGGAGFEGQMTGIACFMPSIADLDGSGNVDVVVEGAVLDGAKGTVKAKLPGTTFVISDIDGDGTLDIVTGTAAYHSDGTVLATAPSTVVGEWPAIGDLNLDGKPEIVTINFPTHTLSIWHYDPNAPTKATVVRTGIDINGTAPQHCGPSEGLTEGGGPPTIADFNGDGVPDVALAGGIAYTILDGKKLMDPSFANAATILWTSVTQDCTSASTGSSVFDFEGTGVAQAVYSDENYLRIYDGPTGNVLWKTCNTTGTEQEYPVIADVDNDGHADIVVVSNAAGVGPSPTSEIWCSDNPNDPTAPHAQAGVRVFGDANGTWVRTRSIWNEHAYHITNVNDDGSIPQHELPNWQQAGFNNFRQNKQLGDVFAAPDLVVSIAPVCPGPTALVATVRNIGQAAAPAGVVVGFYEGTPPGTKLGQATTTQILYPAESQAVTLPLANPDMGLVSGATPVWARVDDTATPHPSWHECNIMNDTSALVSARCGTAK
jgi:hypothetical protein